MEAAEASSLCLVMGSYISVTQSLHRSLDLQLSLEDSLTAFQFLGCAFQFALDPSPQHIQSHTYTLTYI